VVDTDHAGDRVISALDALNERREDQSAPYWAGYLARR
jgi:hypothetical protein